MYAVYRLWDPRDHMTFYVGMTDDVYERFFAHIRCNSNNMTKNARIMELRSANLMVQLEVLETTEDIEYARIREAYWIQHYEMLGHPLTNVHRPGQQLKMKVIVRSARATRKLVEKQLRQSLDEEIPLVDRTERDPSEKKKEDQLEMSVLAERVMSAWQEGHTGVRKIARELSITYYQARALCIHLRLI